MRKAIALGLALAAVALPFEASAADEATLSCVEGKLDAAAKARISSYVDGVMRIPPDGTLRQSPEVQADLGVAMHACARQHGWSDAAAKAAGGYALAKIGLPAAAAALAGFNIDPVKAEAIYAALPLETRETPLSDGEHRDVIRDIALAALDQGLIKTAYEARVMGRYIGYLNARDSSRAAFLRS